MSISVNLIYLKRKDGNGRQFYSRYGSQLRPTNFHYRKVFDELSIIGLAMGAFEISFTGYFDDANFIIDDITYFNTRNHCHKYHSDRDMLRNAYDIVCKHLEYVKLNLKYDPDDWTEIEKHKDFWDCL